MYEIKDKVSKIEFQIKSNLPPNEGIFYDGQIFDAWQFVSQLIKEAEKSIVLIDNYVDESVLMLLCKRNPGVKAVIFTANINKQLETDLKKHNQLISLFLEPHRHNRHNLCAVAYRFHIVFKTIKKFLVLPTQ